MPEYNYPEVIFVNGTGDTANNAYMDIRFQLQSAYQCCLIAADVDGGEEATEAREATDVALLNLIDTYTGIGEDTTVEFTLLYQDQVQNCINTASYSDKIDILESIIVQVNSQIV